MTAESFEIMKLWIPLDKATTQGPGNYVTWTPINSQATESKWAEASQLASIGWELVSAIPISNALINTAVNVDIAFSYTCGYVLLFKRKI